MKKFLALIFVASLCGSANAQFNDLLNSAKSALASKSTGSSNSNVSTLSNIIQSKLVPTSSQIVGTWAYQEPAVMFTSSNALKNAASSVDTKSVETKLQSYLSKVGINNGKFSITFKEDKTFVVNYGSKTAKKGTYAITGNDITLTFDGKTKPSKLTPQLDNGTLVVVADATKFKTLMENVGAQVSQLNTVTSLMKGMDGMKIGVRMAKQ
jgi:hypothetical protein